MGDILAGFVADARYHRQERERLQQDEEWIKGASNQEIEAEAARYAEVIRESQHFAPFVQKYLRFVKIGESVELEGEHYPIVYQKGVLTSWRSHYEVDYQKGVLNWRRTNQKLTCASVEYRRNHDLVTYDRGIHRYRESALTFGVDVEVYGGGIQRVGDSIETFEKTTKEEPIQLAEPNPEWENYFRSDIELVVGGFLKAAKLRLLKKN